MIDRDEVTQGSTIFALSSGSLPAAVAVVRLSGPRVGAIWRAMISAKPVPRRACLCSIYDPQTREIIDRAMCLWLPGPASFSGEDMAEWQTHGSPAVITMLTNILTSMPGVRPAKPGEFTRRAFDNGKLELTRVEAMADLIQAHSQRQRRAALTQMEGAAGRLYQGWIKILMTARARIEASIDFSDEDLPDDLLSSTRGQLSRLYDAMIAHLDGNRGGQWLRTGIPCALVGAPNTGKSSLFNRLLGRSAAIVSPWAGTTRDVLEAPMMIGGWPFLMADMAGLRQASKLIERQGIQRALRQASDAAIILRLFAADVPLKREQKRWLSGRKATTATSDHQKVPVLALINKGDQPIMDDFVERIKRKAKRYDWHGPYIISAQTGDGIDRLSAWLEGQAKTLSGTEIPVLTRQRQRRLVREAASHIEDGLTSALDIMAESLSLATICLDDVVGAPTADTEALLDHLFSEFCLGK